MLLYVCVLGVVTVHLSAGSVIISRDEPDYVCQTEDCKKTAKRILDYMDPSTNPCDDFYRFTCGTFLDAPGLKDNELNMSLTQLEEVIDEQLLSIVRSAPEPNEIRAYQILRNFTSLCMQSDVMEAREITQRLSLLERAGGWPVLGNWRSDNWSLLDTVIKLRHLGLESDSLFSIYVAADPRDPTRSVIHVDQPTLRLSQNKEKMLKAATLLGADPERAERQLTDAMLFERELKRISAPEISRQLHHLMYNPHTQDELMDQFGWLDWGHLLTSIFPHDIHPSIIKKKPVIIKSVEYLRQLEFVLKEHQPMVIANYLMWNAAFSLTYFQKTFVLPFKKPKLEMPGEDLASRCARFLSSTPCLSLTLNSIYVKKFLSSAKQSYKGVTEMVENIAYEMARDIDGLDWIDDQTKAEALHKVKKMKKVIGYPKELEDDSKLNKLFEGFTLDAENFTAAMAAMWEWEENNTMSLMDDKPDPNDWRMPGMYATMANAFYMPDSNAMVIPAAIIQWPFYSPDVPMALNYGSIGMIMGHEISHGFDNQGSAYDSDGKLRDWWKDSTKEMFDQKKKCFINQYDHYKNVNGSVTQSENIADNAGMKLAFRAYRSQAANEVTTDLVLPGLEQFNSDQLFFLGMGNIWCSRIGEGKLMKMAEYEDPHSPPEFRVNGVSTNFPIFAKLFRCETGSPMNHKGKCELW